MRVSIDLVFPEDPFSGCHIVIISIYSAYLFVLTLETLFWSLKVSRYCIFSCQSTKAI